jgi:hypothetical protein
MAPANTTALASKVRRALLKRLTSMAPFNHKTGAQKKAPAVSRGGWQVAVR